MTPALSILDLRVDYGTHVAVDGLNLEVMPGEIMGLVGPNGAGKSSTFRVAATLQEPTYGEVRVCGQDVFEHQAKVRALTGYMPDLAPAATDLKLWEFLELFAAAYGLRGRAQKVRVEECLEVVKLTDKREVFCGTLSRGMMQRLVLAKTLLHRPSLMLLDEPASGMDPPSRVHLRKTLRALADQGTAVLISSHILSELADMCTDVAIMREGKLVTGGKMESVLSAHQRPRREIFMRVLGSADPAVARLREDSQAQDVTVLGAEIRFFHTGDEEAQAALLKSLVDAGVRIRSFEERATSIEDVVMRLEESA